jgi:acylaminoacyl-peptidase
MKFISSLKFEYEEDWGEKYVGVGSLLLCVLDTVNGRVSVLDTLSADSTITIGSPCFSPAVSSYDLVYTAWKNTPRKLGMIYCYHRPCAIFKVDVARLLEDKDTLPKLVSRGLALARSARIHPDGKSVVFIGRKDPLECHNGCFELYRASLESDDVELERLLEVVDKPCGDLPTDLPADAMSTLIQSLTEVVFPGLFTDQLPRRCFSSDGSRIHFTSQWGFSEAIVSFDLRTRTITRLAELTKIVQTSAQDNSALPSCSVLDISDDWLLYSGIFIIIC